MRNCFLNRFCAKRKTARRRSIQLQYNADHGITPKQIQKAITSALPTSKEEADYEHYKIPKFYTFPSKDAKERILYQNFVSVNADVKEMIKTILMFKVKT